MGHVTIDHVDMSFFDYVYFSMFKFILKIIYFCILADISCTLYVGFIRYWVFHVGHMLLPLFLYYLASIVKHEYQKLNDLISVPDVNWTQTSLK